MAVRCFPSASLMLPAVCKYNVFVLSGFDHDSFYLQLHWISVALDNHIDHCCGIKSKTRS